MGSPVRSLEWFARTYSIRVLHHASFPLLTTAPSPEVYAIVRLAPGMVRRTRRAGQSQGHGQRFLAVPKLRVLVLLRPSSTSTDLPARSPPFPTMHRHTAMHTLGVLRCLKVLSWAPLFVLFHHIARLPMEVALRAALALQHIFAPTRRGQAWPRVDPFATAHSEDKFKAKYRFYRNDVRALARALGLPTIVRAGTRHTMHRDHAVLCLLAKYVASCNLSGGVSTLREAIAPSSVGVQVCKREGLR